jgi:hypothetical protein
MDLDHQPSWYMLWVPEISLLGEEEATTIPRIYKGGQDPATGASSTRTTKIHKGCFLFTHGKGIQSIMNTHQVSE